MNINSGIEQNTSEGKCFIPICFVIEKKEEKCSSFYAIVKAYSIEEKLFIDVGHFYITNVFEFS